MGKLFTDQKIQYLNSGHTLGRRTKKGLPQGFTLVELLIVIVVIAILAAVTIVAYQNITKRAEAATVQSDLAQVATAVGTYYVDNGTYPSLLADANVRDSGGVTYYYTSDNTVNPSTWCATATKNTTSYYVSNADMRPSAGSCPITNLIQNPSAEVSGTNKWQAFGYASISQSTLWASSGSASFQIQNTAGGDADMRIVGSGTNTMPPGIQPGHTYTFSAQLHMPVAFTTTSSTRTPRVVYWYSTPTQTNAQSFGPAVPAIAGDYRVSYTFTLPANAIGVYLGLGAGTGTSGQSFYYDSIMLTDGATLFNYADGSSPGWSWNGTPNASTSTGPAL